VTRRLKIVIAPDKFKGSLTASQAAQSVEAGFKTIFPSAEYVVLPVADGGEGTLEALVGARRGSIEEASVSGPDGRPIAAAFGVLGDGETAVVELAKASGLALVARGRNNPLTATTFGTGQLIGAAIDGGAKRAIIAVGGSATNDAGAGALEALGAKFSDAGGRLLPRGGAALATLQRIETEKLRERIEHVAIDIATDVNNPLCGPNGASAVYAPQKGADPEAVRLLDAALAHFADVVAELAGADLRDVPGTGAAGGFGFGFAALTGATLRGGAQLVLDLVGFDRHLNGAALVVTGEGKLDSQTHSGKTPAAVAQAARKRDVRVVAVCGALEISKGDLEIMGIEKAVAATPRGMPLETALVCAADLVRQAAAKLAEELPDLGRVVES